MDGADSAKEYEYDANGNVTKDLNRNILSIQYNSLNLLSMIKFADGKTIKYTYSADGRKLRVVYTTVTPATSKQVDYCGNLIFENGQLKQMLVDGGYIPMDDWSGTYRFYVKDHLGNNRMVMHEYYGAEQMNNYYPFGADFCDLNRVSYVQNHKYNGKELDRMHGLDTYDYGARQYNPVTARWDRMDPLCETDYDVSPYAYCLNSPINNIDLWGLKSYDPQTAQDNWDDFDTSKDDILLNEIVCTPNGNSQGGSSYLDNNISGRSSYLDCNISDILNTISNISFFTSNEATASGSACEAYIEWGTPSHAEKKMTKRVLKKIGSQTKT